MSVVEGSIQILSKTNAQLTALGSPWIPLKGQWFFVTDQAKVGIGDGVTTYASLVKVPLSQASRLVDGYLDNVDFRRFKNVYNLTIIKMMH